MNFLTVKQVAEKLNVGIARVHQLIQAGRIPAEKFGSVYAIRESDLKLVKERNNGRPPKKK